MNEKEVINIDKVFLILGYLLAIAIFVTLIGIKRGKIHEKYIFTVYVEIVGIFLLFIIWGYLRNISWYVEIFINIYKKQK